LTWINRI